MTDTSVTPIREMKRVDQLERGDWLAAGPYNDRVDGTDDAEVLHVHPYGNKVAVTIQEATVPEPEIIRLWAASKVTLLTAEEIAEREREASRLRLVDELRAFTNLAAGGLPVPDSLDISVSVATRAEVLALAEGLGVETAPWITTGLSARWPSGRQGYEPGFHFLAYTDEKEPEPGTRCEDLDDADPTGLLHSREADDPTPVSPARVPLHTGGLEGIAEPAAVHAASGDKLVVDGCE
jgi:hypothetical protein